MRIGARAPTELSVTRTGPASSTPSNFLAGIAFAATAGVLWGGVFVVPLLLPEYPPTYLAAGRYLAFGMVAATIALTDRAALDRLTKRDWYEAMGLTLVGNLAYYSLLAAAIQRSGAPVPSMIIGALPLVLMSASQVVPGAAPLPLRRLLPCFLLIGAGIVLVDRSEAGALLATARRTDILAGSLYATGALACWTWYPLRNAYWLERSRLPARTWATAQGLATLPLAAAFALLAMAQQRLARPTFSFLGPQPQKFLLLMLALGLLASWVGTACWNAASRRLPVALIGALVVFETVFALIDAWLLRRTWPSPDQLLALALLVIGVGLASVISRPPDFARSAGSTP